MDGLPWNTLLTSIKIDDLGVPLFLETSIFRCELLPMGETVYFPTNWSHKHQPFVYR